MSTEKDTDSGSNHGGSNHGGDNPEREPGEVADDQLPDDLQPSEDNPLARHPEQTGDADDAIGQDREGGAETAPLEAEQADYGGSGQG